MQAIVDVDGLFSFVYIVRNNGSGWVLLLPRARPKLKLKVISHAFRLLFLRLARSPIYFELEHLLSSQFFTGKVSQYSTA